MWQEKMGFYWHLYFDLLIDKQYDVALSPHHIFEDSEKKENNKETANNEINEKNESKLKDQNNEAQNIDSDIAKVDDLSENDMSDKEVEQRFINIDTMLYDKL